MTNSKERLTATVVVLQLNRYYPYHRTNRQTPRFGLKEELGCCCCSSGARPAGGGGGGAATTATAAAAACGGAALALASRSDDAFFELHHDHRQQLRPVLSNY